MAETNEAGLVRGIRRWDLVALIINSMVGAGIFVERLLCMPQIPARERDLQRRAAGDAPRDDGEARLGPRLRVRVRIFEPAGDVALAGGET